MTVKQKNKLWIGLIILYVLVYYAWIIISPGNAAVTTPGRNSFSLMGSIIPTFWLYRATRQANPDRKAFWMFLTLGTFSYFIAEVFRFTYESILNRPVPFPSTAYVFYLLTISFYISAFVHILYKYRRTLQVTRHIFDALLTSIFFTTLSWHFILEPLVLLGGVSRFDLFISLLYPLGALILLYCLTLVFFSGKKLFSTKIQWIYFIGILTYTFAVSAFLYLVGINSYTAESWLDPLFITGILLIGYTGLLQNEEDSLVEPSEVSEKTTCHFYTLLCPISVWPYFI